MTHLIAGLLLFYSVAASAGFESEANAQIRLDAYISEAQSRCAAPEADEEIITSLDFSWGQTPEQVAAKQALLYASGKRLFMRVRFDRPSGTFKLPFSGPEKGKEVELKDHFIKSTIRHIETAMRMGYAATLNFSDMGHSHMYIPKEWHQKNIAGRGIVDMHKQYEEILAYPETKFLYHVAEQIDTLKVLEKDPKAKLLNWKYWLRNLVGDNHVLGRVDIQKDLKANYNTVKSLEGYRYHGSGLYFQASQDGCFAYLHKGKKVYFDITHHEIPYRYRDGDDLAL